MGQAKQRGTFEERKAQALARESARRTEEQKASAIRYANRPRPVALSAYNSRVYLLALAAALSVQGKP